MIIDLLADLAGIAARAASRSMGVDILERSVGTMESRNESRADD